MHKANSRKMLTQILIILLNLSTSCFNRLNLQLIKNTKAKALTLELVKVI